MIIKCVLYAVGFIAAGVLLYKTDTSYASVVPAAKPSTSSSQRVTGHQQRYWVKHTDGYKPQWRSKAPYYR